MRGYRGGNVAGLTLRPPSNCGHQTEAPAETLPGWTGVDLGTAGYAVVKINRVVPRQAPDAQRAQQERQQYVQWLATAEGLAYYELLKQRFKVQIKVPRPEAVTAVTAEN